MFEHKYKCFGSFVEPTGLNKQVDNFTLLPIVILDFSELF